MIRKFMFLKGGDDPGRHVAPAGGSAADRCILNRVLPAVPGITPDPLWDALLEIRLEAGEEEPGSGLPAGAERSVAFLAEEKVVVDGPRRGVKILSLPRRRAGMSPADFSRHYSDVHGALVRRNEAFTRHALRYVQHHVLPRTVRASEGFVPYDGISEFWFDSLDDAKAAWAAPSYMAELRADEKNFVGSPPSHRLLVVETAFPLP